MRRGPVVLVAVVAALLAQVVLTGAFHRSQVRTAALSQVEVLGATAVCPDVRQIPGVMQTRVSLGVTPLPVGRTTSGGSVITSATSHPATLTRVPLTQPGQVAVNLGRAVADDGVAVHASQALASGLEVEEVARGTNGSARGLAGLRCEPPSRDTWFLGASTGLIDHATLVMVNVDDTPATVDVTAFGKEGRVDPRPGQGLTLLPRTRLALPLEVLAPDMTSLAVRVRARQGRVAATIRDIRVLDHVPLGFEFVPPALPPATTTVVPGIPLGPGVRRLLIANPGEDDTTVSLQVSLRDGQFVPSGLDQVGVPGGHTVAVDLTRFTDASPVTVRVTSSGAPVLAAAWLVDRLRFQVGPVLEMAFASSAEPLSGSAVLTDLIIDRPTESDLVLSAPDEAANVTITPIRVLGSALEPPTPRRVHIPAGRTVTFGLAGFYPPGTQAQLAVQVRPDPDSGPVYATRYLRERGGHGALSTLLDLQGPAELVDRPTVLEDPSAGYR